MGGYGSHLSCADSIRAMGMRLPLDDASVCYSTHSDVSLGREASSSDEGRGSRDYRSRAIYRYIMDCVLMNRDYRGFFCARYSPQCSSGVHMKYTSALYTVICKQKTEGNKL